MFWLARGSGARIPIRPEGVTIGRGARSDIVVDDPDVSRMQAIIYASEPTPTIVVVGKADTTLNGRVLPTAGEHALATDDRLVIAGTELVVVEESAPSTPSSAWMLRDPEGHAIGVTRTPFLVGGSARADLRVDGWPDVVMRFHLAHALHVEACEPIRLRALELGPGEVELVRIDSVIAYRDVAFRLVAGGPTQEAVTAPRRGCPDRVTLEFLPRGGRLTMGWGEREACAYLPERRCELLALLLHPPAPLRPGELVSDEVVIARLWPGQARSRVDLNVVIHRARADLLRAGLDGGLIERAHGGSATRVQVDASTRIAVL